MMTIEELRRRKAELGLTNRALAELSGVPLGTVQKVLAGETRSPREKTLYALERALAPTPQQRDTYHADAGHRQGSISSADMLRETARVYGSNAEDPYGRDQPHRGGTCTLEDYLALPEERRAELIDGVLYDMAAPTTWHQAIAGFIYKLLLDHALEKGGPCMPLMSPVDVQLDCDDRTVVQPDVMIVCDRSKFRNGRVFGAPDLSVEVLSPSSRKRDMSLKLYKYANAGVREYWIVDPDRQRVVVYDLEHDELPVIYGFDARIPVLIWNGEYEIDLAVIWENVGFLY